MTADAADPDAVPVTGEAVELDLRVARLPSRTLALLLDLVIQTPALVVVLVLVGWLASAVDPAAAAALALVGTVAVIVGYPVLCESLTRGRTVGMLALGLRVVRDDGGPVRFRHALVRGLFLVPELWLTVGVLGLVAALLSARDKRLGDHFAGTLVVIERVTRAAALPSAATVPVELAPWAATLDLVHLPTAQVAQARSLLGRWSALAPATRERLAAALATEIGARVSPPPPPGCPPAAYLSAVLGEQARRAAAAPVPGPRSAAAAPQLPPAVARPDDEPPFARPR
jgi:uncharacterized RDD family membrane protein YckC